MPVKNSTQSLRKTLEQVYKTTGKKPKELAEAKPISIKFQYLYLWYLDIKTSEAITFTELKNWCELTNNKLTNWELDTIRAIDRIYWNIQYERNSTPTN